MLLQWGKQNTRNNRIITLHVAHSNLQYLVFTSEIFDDNDYNDGVGGVSINDKTITSFKIIPYVYDYMWLTLGT